MFSVNEGVADWLRLPARELSAITARAAEVRTWTSLMFVADIVRNRILDVHLTEVTNLGTSRSADNAGVEKVQVHDASDVRSSHVNYQQYTHAGC
jgi:hypothetical protein